jgi:hypothetical protein
MRKRLLRDKEAIDGGENSELPDEGKRLQFPPNRALVDADGEVYDIAVGNILAVRHNDEGEFTSICESDLPTIQKYLRPVLKARATLIILPTEEWLEVGEEVE